VVQRFSIDVQHQRGQRLFGEWTLRQSAGTPQGRPQTVRTRPAASSRRWHPAGPAPPQQRPSRVTNSRRFLILSASSDSLLGIGCQGGRVRAARCTGRPLPRQGCCALLRDGLRPPLTREPLPSLGRLFRAGGGLPWVTRSPNPLGWVGA
jgi:hypothetical protein